MAQQVSFEFERDRTLEVNGQEFPILLDEDVILDKMIEYSGLDRKDVTEKNYRAVQTEFFGFCDKMLGDGALKKIVGGHRMSIEKKAALVMAIATAACETYRKRLDDYDE